MPDRDLDIVEEISDMIEYFTIARGLMQSDAEGLSEAVTSWILDNYKGERVRIPKGQRRCQFAEQIKTEFDGTNLVEIMERYGVSRATVYRCKNE